MMERLDDRVDLGGWDSSTHPVLHEIIEELKPKRIIEVGVWKGRSVWWMAKKISDMGIETEIVAVDTWLGSPELIKDARYADSVPRSYETFLANMYSTGAYKVVTALRQASSAAAIMLRQAEMMAEMIHIDAGHQSWEVHRDLEDYTPLLAEGGAIVGDDFNWQSVREGVTAFCKSGEWTAEDHGRKFVMRRT